MCKENRIKYDYTQQHNSLTKLGFIKSTNPKNVIFQRSCKLHQISYVTTTNYLWLPSIPFFKCNPTVCRSHQCAHNLLNNSSCRFSSYMSWITFPNDILIGLCTNYFTSQSSPHMTFAKFPIEYASNFKIVWCLLAIC